MPTTTRFCRVFGFPAGLSTVGYRLYLGSTPAAGRVTAGVAAQPTPGSYAASVTYDDAAADFIQWDSGTTPDRVAGEDLPAAPSGSGSAPTPGGSGGVGSPGGGVVYTGLKLPASAPASIFRLVVARLRNDPVLGRAVKTWRAWDGSAADATEPSLSQCPWVRLTPDGGPEEFWAASTMKGPLAVNVEMWVAGACVDDVTNLWFQIQRAIYPTTAATRLAFQKALRDAGAHTGEVKFTRPAFAAEPAADHMEATGQMVLDYRFDQNPTAPGY